jgi:hypothetical protein
VDWTEALDLVVARTGHVRYRELCADEHPEHEIHRRRVIEKATGMPPTPEGYPSLFAQTRNLAGAVGRVISAVVQGQAVKVEPSVYYERLAICRSCEHNGEAPLGFRCKLCGCRGLKLELAPEQCPDNPPRWLKVTS